MHQQEGTFVYLSFTLCCLPIVMSQRYTDCVNVFLFIARDILLFIPKCGINKGSPRQLRA